MSINFPQNETTSKLCKGAQARRNCKYCKYDLKFVINDFLWPKFGNANYEEENKKECNFSHRINSQSLEDTQVGYILQNYTLDKYTLEKYTLEQRLKKSLTKVKN